MKQAKYLLAALAVLLPPLLNFGHAFAGGSTYDNYSNLRLTASKTSATANGSDSITFTINFFKHKCVSGVYRTFSSGCNDQGGVSKEVAVTCTVAACRQTNYVHAKVSVSGSGNALSNTLLYPDGSGKATFTLKSTAAGSKTINISNEAPSSSGSHAEASKAVTFSAPTPAPTSTPTTTQNSTKTEAEAPGTPKPSSITVDGEKISTDKDIELEEGKPLVLSGKTVPNGTVKLYIFSEPKTATVKADKNGNWTYTVENLPAGDHHVESEVTDPTTGKTSKRATVLAFTVKAAETEPAQEASTSDDSQPTKTNSLVLPAAAAAVLLLGAGAGFWWWKKKRSKLKNTERNATQTAHPAENSEQPHNETLPETAKTDESVPDDSAKSEEKDSDQKP